MAQVLLAQVCLLAAGPNQMLAEDWLSSVIREPVATSSPSLVQPTCQDLQSLTPLTSLQPRC